MGHKSKLGEEADTYPRVVACLADGWRVIASRCDIQWILQRRAGRRHGAPRWEGRRYHRTRSGLEASVRDFLGPEGTSTLKSLGLPERYPEGEPRLAAAVLEVAA